MSEAIKKEDSEIVHGETVLEEDSEVVVTEQTKLWVSGTIFLLFINSTTLVSLSIVDNPKGLPLINYN